MRIRTENTNDLCSLGRDHIKDSIHRLIAISHYEQKMFAFNPGLLGGNMQTVEQELTREQFQLLLEYITGGNLF